jgi:hypothetical protein
MAVELQHLQAPSISTPVPGFQQTESFTRLQTVEGQDALQHLIEARLMETNFSMHGSDVVVTPTFLNGAGLDHFVIPKQIWDVYADHRLTIEHGDRAMTDSTTGVQEASGWRLDLRKTGTPGFVRSGEDVGFEIRIQPRLLLGTSLPCTSLSTTSSVQDLASDVIHSYESIDSQLICSRVAPASPLKSTYQGQDAPVHAYWARKEEIVTNAADALYGAEIVGDSQPNGDRGFLIEWRYLGSASVYDRSVTASSIDLVGPDLQKVVDAFHASAVHNICNNDYAGCY